MLAAVESNLTTADRRPGGPAFVGIPRFASNCQRPLAGNATVGSRPLCEVANYVKAACRSRCSRAAKPTPSSHSFGPPVTGSARRVPDSARFLGSDSSRRACLAIRARIVVPTTVSCGRLEEYWKQSVTDFRPATARVITGTMTKADPSSSSSPRVQTSSRSPATLQKAEALCAVPAPVGSRKISNHDDLR